MPRLANEWYYSERAEELKRVHESLTPEQREQLMQELERLIEQKRQTAFKWRRMTWRD